MQNLWNEDEAEKFENDLLQLRVYSSRLLGGEPSLVLHGGGNTSVKLEELLYVKGSGWDLAKIEKKGFSPVKLKVLLELAELQTLTDTEMVRLQRAAMPNSDAPNPSVESILHALIPFRYVDHTHADAVVAISNSPGGFEKILSIYENQVLIIPYVMPGFILAKKVYELTRGVDWSKLKGMVLMHHGIFSFADDARTSYQRMIELVTKAEEFLKNHNAFGLPHKRLNQPPAPLQKLAQIRKIVGSALGKPIVTLLNTSDEAITYSLATIANPGPLTPDHILHTKQKPVMLHEPFDSAVAGFTQDYHNYFQRYANTSLTMLDPVPRWAIWPNYGTLSFGTSLARTQVVADISKHTIQAIQWAEAIGGWRALPEKDLFDVEYWELEQAKLKKSTVTPPLQGKIALVTGAASGIGKACTEELLDQGAVVVGLDIKTSDCSSKNYMGLICNVCDEKAVQEAVENVVLQFGGLDIVVSNAGSFPAAKTIDQMDLEFWDQTLNLNLTSHFLLLKTCLAYLKEGFDPTVVIIGSKNVPAPGPGAAAYSSAKAGLTQLARVAALELGQYGIRVNVIHPNAVFDTGIWTPSVLESRARSYGLSVEDYKRKNILQTEVCSKDVALLVATLAGSAFLKTTGAQIPIDGGNERVI